MSRIARQVPSPLRNCDGIARRDFVRVGGLTALGLGLSQIASRLRAGEADPSADLGPSSGRSSFGRAKRCVLIWLDGGPSHLETFDLKPDAPKEVRGPFQPIPTRIAGEQVCELMPRTAENMRDIALIRSMTSPLGEHNFGAHYMLTGYKPTPAVEYPSFGSVIAHERGGAGEVKKALPSHVAIPRFRVGGGRMDGAGFLGPAYRPFSVGGDPAKRDFQVRDLDFFPGMNDDRLERRRRFLQALDQFQAGVESEAVDPQLTQDPEFEQAYRLLTSPEAKRAFALEEEDGETRSRYGVRTIGQSCLLARRLLERGVPFVTVNNPGWDTHENAYTRLKEGYTGAKVPVGLVPSLDLAMNALLDDLRERGMLEETLVVVMGEFGRTPKLNTQGGRDHWPRVFSVAVAGAGITGQVIGKSDSVAEGPRDRPVTPSDLAASLYHLLGVHPDRRLYTPDGRPIEVNRDGALIRELIG